MNEPYSNSQRTTVLRAIVKLFTKVNAQRYYVRRGPVNWSQFDFDKHPYAVSILCDETSFLRIETPQSMMISVEIFMKMKAESELGQGNLDDTGIDTLIEDLQVVCAELEALMQTGMQPSDLDNVIFKLDHNHDKIVEISDTLQGLQGIWGVFIVEY